MKKYILMMAALFATNQSFSADTNPFPIESLPVELQLMILPLAPGENLEKYIQNIKNFISTNRFLHGFLDNGNQIQSLLTEMSKQIGVSELVIAYVLDTPGARQWLAQQDPKMQNTFLKIFDEITQDKFLKSGFYNSKYFAKLALELNVRAARIFYNYIVRRFKEMVRLDPSYMTGAIDLNGPQIPPIMLANMRRAWKNDSVLYNRYKNFAFLLVKLQDEINEFISTSFSHGDFETVEYMAIHFLNEEILPKLPDGPFKKEALEYIENNLEDPLVQK